MRISELTYVADGLTMRSEVYIPGGEGQRPGVLVFPEALGLGEHARSRTHELAELGYIALASDLHGDSTLYQDAGAVSALLRPLAATPERIRARAQGALDALLSVPEVDPTRIAAIGFCFGGSMALELARSGAPLVATIGFHSGLQTARPEDAKNIHGRVLVAIGADDPVINATQRSDFELEMRQGKVDWQMHIYGGVVHAFTDKNAERLGRAEFARYSGLADAHSWLSMCKLLEESFA